MCDLGKDQMTKGWKLEVEWSDGMTSLVPLKNSKESNPVKVTEYSISAAIANEPTFTLRVQHVLQMQDKILQKVKSHYLMWMHKYGVKLTHSVEEAYAVDKHTRTDFWEKAMEKEMKKVTIALEFHYDNIVPVG